MPTQPKGDTRNSRANDMPRVTANLGAGAFDSRIGVNDSDTSTEGMTNSTNPSGGLTVISACDAMMPIIWTIMYSDRVWPRVSLVAVSFSQLSAVT